MKKRKLKKWVKVAISLIVVMVGLLIYAKTGILGQLAQDSIIYLLICITAWIWLFLGQFSLLYFIWKEILFRIIGR